VHDPPPRTAKERKGQKNEDDKEWRLLSLLICIDTGDVVVWGSNEESQLGIEGESFLSAPTSNPHLSGQGIIAVACGTGLTVALSGTTPRHAYVKLSWSCCDTSA
jgi:alpha-tubulin suppressor-like RCC1 family protein